MATIDASTQAILKTRAIDKMEENVFAGNPLMTLVSKKSGVGGKSFQVPLQIGSNVARGHRFQDAVANVAVSKKVETDCVFQEGYVFGYAPGVDSALSSGGQNSVGDLLGIEQDVAYAAAGALIEQQMVAGDAFGTLAVVSSVVSGTTGTVVFQLADASQCRYIYVGDVLSAKSNPATASLQAGTWTVSVVDEMQARITAVAAGGADATSYAGYSLGLAATYANSTTAQTLQSLKTMFTRTNLSSAYEGLASRAADPVRLAGIVFSVGSMSVKDSISLLMSSLGNYPGAKPEFALVSSNSYLELEQDLGNKVRYTTTNGTGAGKGANVDLPSITYQGPRGPVTVIQIPAMADTDIYVIDSSSLELVTPGDDIVTTREKDNAGWITLQNSDAMRLDLRTLGTFVCKAFFKNGRAIRTV